ncbi:MAG: ATP-binding cassette domain-containing protein, partial [Deltaproteobacteria bacterium]|nr:ATP-binding cassette domain-containing protein [Deltaproteobacteria bacterium]
TTLINMVSGFLKPDEGMIMLEGENVMGLPAHKMAKKGIVRTFQILRPFYSARACHNVVLSLLSARAKKKKHLQRFGQAEQIAMDLMELLGFERRSDAFKMTRTLPPGYLRRLDIARAIATEPKLLLVDEPFSELTSIEAVSVRSALQKLNAAGMTIMIVEHRLRYIMDMADKVVVMHQGAKIAEGPPAHILDEEKVKAFYHD